MPDNLSCDLQQNRLHLPDCRAHTVFKGEHVLQTSKPPDLNMQKNKMWMPGLEKWHPTTKYHWINTNNRKESRKFSISVMVSCTSFQRWILHRGVSLSINNKGILKIVFSKVFRAAHRGVRQVVTWATAALCFFISSFMSSWSSSIRDCRSFFSLCRRLTCSSNWSIERNRIYTHFRRKWQDFIHELLNMINGH